MRAFSFLSLLPLLAAAPGATAAAAATAAPGESTSITFQIGVPHHIQEQQQEASVGMQQQLLTGILAWTRATLEAGDGRHYVSAPITAGGKLVFANVTAGSYLGEVHCATHVFSPLRVDVEAEGAQGDPAASLLVTRITETYRGNDWANRGEALRRVATTSADDSTDGPTFLVAPLALQTKAYYSERSTFSVLSLLKNPMILMALVAMVLMFGMPYMIDQMDPEMRAEFEERQKSNPMSSILGGGGGGGGGGRAAPGSNFDMAAFLAGSGSSNDKKQGGGAGRR